MEKWKRGWCDDVFFVFSLLLEHYEVGWSASREKPWRWFDIRIYNTHYNIIHSYLHVSITFTEKGGPLRPNHPEAASNLHYVLYREFSFLSFFLVFMHTYTYVFEHFLHQIILYLYVTIREKEDYIGGDLCRTHKARTPNREQKRAKERERERWRLFIGKIYTDWVWYTNWVLKEYNTWNRYFHVFVKNKLIWLWRYLYLPFL